MWLQFDWPTIWLTGGVLLALATILAIKFDCESQPETTLRSDPATWQRLSPSGTNMEIQRDREAA